jgi:hypothetical protein
VFEFCRRFPAGGPCYWKMVAMEARLKNQFVIIPIATKPWQPEKKM